MVAKRRSQSRPKKRGKEHDSLASQETRKRRARNPDATKKDILEACLTCLATDGPEGVSLLRVAQMARVNRSTAYEYFQTREDLIAQTIEWMSHQLLQAVYGEIMLPGKSPIDNLDKLYNQRRAASLLNLNERLANFAMDNPDLCRVWLMQVLTLSDPSTDPFWKAYQLSNIHFTQTKLAQKNIDADVFTVLMLAGTFLWPIWARAHVKSHGRLRDEAKRFLRECLRLSLYGVVSREGFPELVEYYNERGTKK